MPNRLPPIAQASQPAPAGGPSPRAATTKSARSSPAVCVIVITASTGRLRDWSPPKKSATPHERLDASPSATAAMAPYAGERREAGARSPVDGRCGGVLLVADVIAPG